MDLKAASRLGIPNSPLRWTEAVMYFGKLKIRNLRHQSWQGREWRVTLQHLPGPELPKLAGVFLAGVLRLGALESVRHSPALFAGQDDQCIFRLWLLCLEGHFWRFPFAV